jgi:hypothetical protein
MVRKLGMKVRGDGGNQISLAFPNGSRIVGLPGTRANGGVRGFSAVSLLMIDKAARIEESMYKALRPMLAVGDGALWIMSTPFGKRGFFYDNSELGGSNLTRKPLPENAGLVVGHFQLETLDHPIVPAIEAGEGECLLHGGRCDERIEYV